MLDEAGEYYPYSKGFKAGDKKDEKRWKNTQGKIFKGKIFKEKAAIIKKKYNDRGLIEEICKLGESERFQMVKELSKYNIACTVDNLGQVCNDLMYLFIEAATEGENEIDISNVGDGSRIPFGDDVIYIDEVGSHCPYPLCWDLLRKENEGKTIYKYRIVHINPNLNNKQINSEGNLIALCPKCAQEYGLHPSTEMINRLEDIKLMMTSIKEMEDAMNYDRLVDGVEGIIRKMSVMFDEEYEPDIRYNPVEIKKKIKKGNGDLLREIKWRVMDYYFDIKTILQNLDVEGKCNYTNLAKQIRNQYKSINQGDMVPQRQVYDTLVEWLHGATHEDKGSCYSLVSFFVQNCEVFDELSE